MINDQSRNDYDMKMILIQSGFHTEFPLDAGGRKSVRGYPIKYLRPMLANRLDYRDVLTFTIDPADAKGSGGAISISHTRRMATMRSVYTSPMFRTMLKQGSELDKEAERRATSVYLPDRVCPMLPERSSKHPRSSQA
jgi:ribonuclease R